MTTTNYRGKARAVFLAAIMVISMVGMPMAFAGSAAAATTSINLSDNLVQGGDEIDISGNVDSNGTVHVFIDEDNDGNYTSATDTSGSANIENYEEDNEFSVSLNAPTDSGTYDVYVFQDEGETDSTIDEDDEGERSAPLQVDADAPTFGNETPEDGSAITAADEIVVPIEDANTSVQTITATAVVENADGTINTYEINPETADNDGVSWDGSELVIEPGVGNVPSIADGDYDVSVSATDEVGNSDSTTFSFTVDSNVPDSSFVTPGDNVIVNNENQTVDVSLSASAARSINDSTVSLDIVGDTTDYSESFVNTDDEYANSSDTFSVDPSVEGVESFADDTYTVTVSGEDDIGNSFSDTYSFEVDTTSPEVTNVELSETDLNSDSEDPTVTVNFNEPVDASEVSADVLIDGETKETLSFAGSDETVGPTLDIGSYGAVENDSAVINVTSAQDIAGNDLANADADASQTGFAIDTDGPTVELGGLPNDGTLSGYVNITDFVSTAEDVENTEYYIEAGEDSESRVEITDTAENLDTTTLLDGDHRLVVEVTDENGNTDTTKAVNGEFTIDNSQQLTVAQGYINGGFDAFDHQVGEETITVSDLFATTPGDTEYTVNDEDASSGDSINADENRGDTVTVTASSDSAGETRTVTLSFAPLEGAESVSGDTIDIGIKGDQSVDTLNVTVEQVDGHYDANEVSLTRDDFEQIDLNSDEAIYAATVEDLRDGSYDVTITDEEDVTIVNSVGDGVVVNDSNPSVVSASVTSGDENGLTLEAQFDEVVSSVGTVTLADDASVVDSTTVNDDGTVTVSLNEEVQTADAPALNFSNIETPETSSGSTDYTEVGVDTITLDLSADALNVVSIPAETGSVALDDLDLSGVDSVMAYDGDGWSSYDAQTGDGDLQEITGGVGYIVKANQDASVAVNAQNVPSDNDAQAINSVSLNSGWNLVGAYQEGDQSIDQALAPLPSSADWSIQKGYTGTNVDTLEPGAGYWMFTNAESAYHIPVDYTGLQSSQPDVYNLNVPDPLTDGTDDTISAEVDADSPVDRLVVDIPTIGVEGVELTYDDDNGVYDVNITNYEQDIETTQDVDVTVTAFDIYGNLGQASTTTETTENVKATVTSQEVTGSNTVAVTFDEGVEDTAGNALEAADFGYTNNSNVGAGSVTDVNHSAGDATATLTLNATIQNEDVGSDTIDISADTIYDTAGNAVDLVVNTYTDPNKNVKAT